MKKFSEIVLEQAVKIDRSIIDNTRGLGSVPWNLDKFRFVEVLMKPSVFAKLASPLSNPKKNSLDYIEEHIRNGGKIGTPFLVVKLPDDMNDNFKVTNHEGRHRIMIVKKLAGDISFPVQLMIKPAKKDLTPDMLSEMNKGMFQQERSGNFVKGPLFKVIK